MWLLNVTLFPRYLISNVALFNFVSYSSLAINGFRKSKSLNIRNLFPSINCATLMRHFCPDGNKFSNTRIRKDSNIFVTLVLNEPLLYPLLKCLRPFRLPSLIDWLICLSGVTLNILVDISENFRRFGVAELRSLKGGILASWNIRTKISEEKFLPQNYHRLSSVAVSFERSFGPRHILDCFRFWQIGVAQDFRCN